MKKFFIGFALVLCQTLSISQDFGLETWRDHLPYSNVIAVAQTGNSIYAASEYAITIIDQDDNSVESMSSVNGLSDFEISSLASNNTTDHIIVGYANGNIDLLISGQVINMNAIKISSIVGDKKIYGIHSNGNLTYLACGFGIVVLDLQKEEVKDTYIIGENGSQIKCFDICTNNDLLLAATENGIYNANLSTPFLSDFNAWNRIESFPNYGDSYEFIHYQENYTFIINQNVNFQDDTIKQLDLNFSQINVMSGQDFSGIEAKENDELLISQNYDLSICDLNMVQSENIFTYDYSISVNCNYAIWDGSKYWIGDGLYGINSVIANGNHQNYMLPGPLTNNCSHLATLDDQLYVSAGKISGSAWNNNYVGTGVMSFDQYDWRTHNGNTESLIPSDSSFDFINTTIDPKNKKHALLCSFYSGIAEVLDDQVIARYTHENSALNQSLVHGPGEIKVGCAAFDKEGNIWAGNSFVNKPLVLITPDGNSVAFSIGGVGNNTVITDILVEESSQNIWISTRANGLVVYDFNETPEDPSDDSFEVFNHSETTGNIPGTIINCLTQDRDGEIWVGTDEGPGIFFNGANILESSGNTDAQQILLFQDGSYQKLLLTQLITEIAIDGANRKWFATQAGGVFLMSEDGTEQIYAFNTDNSPIFSNTVLSLAINDASGEVYIGTDKGLIGFRSTATAPETGYSNIYCYPNPVRPEYTGPIGIKGLKENSDIKITDASGNFVNSSTSFGGQAVWDGKDIYGTPVASGVYYVFAVAEDGSSKAKTKVLVIR